LEDCNRLFLVPDADLCRLPFDSLPLSDTRFVIDDYEVSYLSAARDLLQLGILRQHPGSQPIVIADPDYDLAEGPHTKHLPDPGLTFRSTDVLDDSDILIGWRESRAIKDHFLYFTRLSGTEAEGHAVAEILGVSPFVSHLALEGILRQCSSPAVLHIATHGFFLPDQGSDLSLVSGFGTSPEQASSIQTENPLLRSGLALAGANTWLAGAALPSEAGDGLLTAEDVSAMDLTNTHWSFFPPARRFAPIKNSPHARAGGSHAARTDRHRRPAPPSNASQCRRPRGLRRPRPAGRLALSRDSLARVT
jgi:hypothetical protein